MILIEHLIKENKKYQNEKRLERNAEQQQQSGICSLISKKFPELDSFFNCNICKFVNYIIKPEKYWPKFLFFFCLKRKSKK